MEERRGEYLPGSFIGNSPVGQGWTWDEMLEAFRALGGTADNIVQRTGSLGRGIFPVDPAQPIKLHVPTNLLLSPDDVEFVDERIRVREAAQIGHKEREFFERYQQDFSWGGGGRSDCAAIVDAFDALPGDVHEALTTEFGMSKRLEGSHEQKVQRQFFWSGSITRDGGIYLMPLMELVNHGPSAAPYGFSEGISIAGQFSSEVLVRYAFVDPFGAFRKWGFASPENQAFSLPMSFDLGPRQLVIEMETSRCSSCGRFGVPEVKVSENRLQLSWVMTGNTRYFRLSKGIFYRVMRDAGHPNVEELFDLILHANRMKFLKLLAALEPSDGELISTLKKMVWYQLATMSYCVGTREL